MRLFSYVVARDFGFAPNPFYGCCTLATCKPEIRRTANIDDWVVGTGSKARSRGDRLVYWMKIGEVLTFDQYWNDPRFQHKKPLLNGSQKQAFGDNIYHKHPTTGKWQQANSHHSLPNGFPNKANVNHDTQADRVLIGFEFAYWGGNGPQIPDSLRSELCKIGPGHKCKFPASFVGVSTSWLLSLSERGYNDRPLDWD